MINLNSPTKIVKQSEVSVSITGVTVERMIDYPDIKTVSVFIEGFNHPIDIWTGVDYDNIGQWSDTDVSNRIIALAASGISPFSH